ncbi:MAG: cytochrome b/b6 domain-containing protein [Parashewanella sp.]
MTNTKAYYIDRGLHWLSAIIIIDMLWGMGTSIHITDYRVKGDLIHKQDAMTTHLFEAIALFVLLGGRILWNRIYPNRDTKMIFQSVRHKVITYGLHYSLYLTFALLAVSGFLSLINGELPLDFLGILSVPFSSVDRDVFGFAFESHEWLTKWLYAVLGIHIVGGLYLHR